MMNHAERMLAIANGSLIDALLEAAQNLRTNPARKEDRVMMRSDILLGSDEMSGIDDVQDLAKLLELYVNRKTDSEDKIAIQVREENLGLYKLQMILVSP